jgi:hypothetical protein
VRARRVEVLVTVIQQLFRHLGRLAKEKRETRRFSQTQKVMPLVPLAAQSLWLAKRCCGQFCPAAHRVRKRRDPDTLRARVPAFLDPGTVSKMQRESPSVF